MTPYLNYIYTIYVIYFFISWTEYVFINEIFLIMYY